MPIYPQNLHTHGTFCDGRYEYEDTVKHAIKLGFSSIGFSGHSYTSFDLEPCMTPEGTAQYKKRIAQLKQKYDGIIDIFCGIEFDVFSEDNPTDYDYVIGDAHYIKKGNEYLVTDYSDPDTLADIIDRHYGGDGVKCAKDYYETMTLVTKLAKCDIVGHFDLITKHCEKHNLIDTNSKFYKDYALQSVTAIAEKIKVFEINVGAIARGYRLTPYPAPFLLKRLKELGCGVVISSDCHDISYLDTNFDMGIDLAKSCGFDEVLILTKDGFKGIKI